MDKHIPVLLDETIELLNVKPNGIYVDLTLGRAGHASEILKRLDSGMLIGVDRDEKALIESKTRLEQISDHFQLVHSNYYNIDHILDSLRIEAVDGVLMDLGVSSPQFDEKERGFSYREDALLDMRMDQTQSLDASYIINNYSLEELTRIFRDYGEDKYAYQIAKKIVKERENTPIKTTFQLVDIIKASKPQKELKKVGHPAKQIFQALRIAVNDELNSLSQALKIIPKRLKKHGGRLVIITFHSLEDRIVKQTFKSLCEIKGNREDIPDVPQNIEYRLVQRKPIVPTEQELIDNHRAKSAKLRAIERL